MIDRSLIGQFGPAFEMPVERGKIREFARATYAPWPEFLEDRRAVIPPTFLTTAGVFWGYTLERPRGTLLEGLDHDLGVPLHAEESYLFHGEPPRAGDVLTARAGLESVVEKKGRRGGALTFLTLLTEFRGRQDELVAEARSVTVTTDSNSTVAPTAPDYRPVYEDREPLDPFAAIEPANPDAVSQGASPGRIDTGALMLRDLVRYAAAGGEDDPLHYDLAHAKATGFPGLFGLGMHQAGGLAAYAARWLGASRLRRFHARFPSMFFVGDELGFEGRVGAVEAVDGRRMVDLDLTCSRPSDNAAVVQASMRFDLTA
jgi:acyl dehydratase